MLLTLYFLGLLGGLIALIWSADKFVASAIAVARQLNVSTLMIGLTVVSVGTSAPEIFVALVSALQEKPGMAFGNAIGSNIANIGLVLGMTAIIVPLPFAKSVLKFEMPWLLLATVLVALILGIDGEVSRIDGWILLVMLVAGIYQMFRIARKRQGLPAGLEEDLNDFEHMGKYQAWIWLFIGLALLAIAGEVVVTCASFIARYFGVPDSVVGLTIVALGTSLPELAATITAATKGHPDLSIGNIVGSNILNILAVLPVAAVVIPYSLSDIEIWRDIGTMVAFTALLAIFAYGFSAEKRVSRGEGAVLLLGYVSYITLVVIQS